MNRKIVKENKLTSLLLSLLCVSVLSWGTWVTVQIFAGDSSVEENKKDNQSISQSIAEVKSDLKDFKKETKEDIRRVEEQANKNQKEILTILLDIKKDNKNKK